MKNKLAAYLASTVLALLAVGCSGNECYENHSALPLASFFSATTMQPVTVQGLEIYGIGAPGDSVLYTNQNLSQAYLPFRLWQDTTQYVFSYEGVVSGYEGQDYIPEAPTDTITFIYKPKEWFASPACGAMYIYEMKDVSHSSFLIDSIAYNEVITNENVTNIKIFFRSEMDQ